MKELQTEDRPVDRGSGRRHYYVGTAIARCALPLVPGARYPANTNEFLSEFFTLTQKRALKPFFRNRINYGEIQRE